MSSDSGEKSDQEVTITGAGISIKDEMTVLTNDEAKELPSDFEKIVDKPDSSEDESIKQKDIIDIQYLESNQENQNDFINDNNNNLEINQKEEIKKNENDIPNSTFLTETAENHLLKATDPIDKKKSSKNLVQPQPIDPAEIESALNSLLDKNKLPPYEYTDTLIQLINHKRMDCLEESDYRGAEKLDAAIDLLIRKNTEESQQKTIQDHEQKFNDRLDSIKNKICDVNNRYDSKIQTIQNNFEERYQQLIASQENQIQQFKEKWQNPDFLKQFDRPSKNLLSMRYLEKQMALSGRYKEAKEAKIQADRIQQNEEREAQKQIEEIMKSEFLKIRNQQQLEVNKMSYRNDALLNEVEIQRKKELEPLNTALKQLDNKLNSKSTPNLKSKSSSIKITIPKTQKTPSKTQKTPRTAQRVIKYKNTYHADFLITPIDDQQFQKLTSMSTRQKSRAKSTLVIKSLPPL